MTIQHVIESLKDRPADSTFLSHENLCRDDGCAVCGDYGGPRLAGRGGGRGLGERTILYCADARVSGFDRMGVPAAAREMKDSSDSLDSQDSSDSQDSLDS